ncbi:hypothetical protein BaRGS_00030332 [Batillaria attramentaria]|uniref:Uncharacterized protein n=1 Tax=Batillaria attramentaria TaxID=370345 RepID=A0ABD0JTU1_9CAEN
MKLKASGGGAAEKPEGKSDPVQQAMPAGQLYQPKEHGGTQTDFEHAQMIFSSDNTCADTERVFSSEEYQNEHLAVFHSRYISDCVRAGNRSKVVLGKYYLPPPDIVALVKNQMTFCWETSSTGNHIQDDSPRRLASSSHTSDRAAINHETSRPHQTDSQNQRVSRTHAAAPQDDQRSAASVPRDHTTRSSSAGHHHQASSSNTSNTDSHVRASDGHTNPRSTDTSVPDKRTGGARSPARTSPRKRSRHASSSPSTGAAAISSAGQQGQASLRRGRDRHISGTENDRETSGHTIVVLADVHHSATEHLEAALGPADTRDGSSSEQASCSAAGTSYYPISRLPKVMGTLEDFIPGLNGCEVLLRSTH